ncbi:MAG: insulinase family protein, partial [Myxococcota bacterium]
MGHLLGVVTQEKLDNQRGVVQNEKRQGDNRPYGTVEYRSLEGLFPEGHPYRWSTIGSMEDLNAASLDDVKAWFKQYYGPNNAVLALAGDIDVETAKPMVEKFFGDIPPGPPLHALSRWVPTKVESVRETMSDRVPNARIYRQWAVPPRTERDTHLLRVVAEILAGGKTSRLYQRLVYEEQLASDVSASVEQHELASIFSVEVDVRRGVDPSVVEAALDEEMDRFIAEDPTSEEVIGARATLNAALVRSLETLGGFSGKAPRLAKGALYAGDAGFWKTAAQWVNEAQPRLLRDTARNWLGRGFYQLSVSPFGEPAAGASVEASVRKTMPKVSRTPDLVFPEVQRTTLSNGIAVVFAERPSVPAVSVMVQFDAGYAADQGSKLGTAGFALDLMDEGTERKSALEISAELDRLGARLTGGSDVDTSRLGVSALKSTLAPAVELLADLVKNPAFSESELERVRKQRLEAISQEMAQPIGLALRFLPPLIYGKEHPY